MPVPPDQQHRSTFLLLLSYLPCLTSLPRSSSRTFLQPLFPPPSPPNARPFIHTTTSSFLRLSCRKRQFLPDIVLLDSQMPGKDGFEVLPKNTKKIAMDCEYQLSIQFLELFVALQSTITGASASSIIIFRGPSAPCKRSAVSSQNEGILHD